MLVPRNPASLNEYIENGKELPVGEFVTLDCRYPLGRYAYETSGSTMGTAFFLASAEDYILTLLEDGSFFTVKVGRQEDIDTLEDLAQELEANYMSASPRSYAVTGRLKRMTDQKILSYYQEALAEIDVPSDDPAARYVILDATDIFTREDAALLGLILIALIAALTFILAWRRDRKHKIPTPSVRLP